MSNSSYDTIYVLIPKAPNSYYNPLPILKQTYKYNLCLLSAVLWDIVKPWLPIYGLTKLLDLSLIWVFISPPAAEDYYGSAYIIGALVLFYF